MKSILCEYNLFRFRLSASSHDDVSFVSVHAIILVLYSAQARPGERHNIELILNNARILDYY